MKRHLSLLFILSCLSSFLFAEAPVTLDSLPVAFGIRLVDLHKAAESGDDRAIPGGKALVIDAEIGSITVRAEEDDRFIAEVELIGGAWQGEESVELYRAYALFDGLPYKNLFSRRSPERLQPGDRVLILARYLGLGVDYDEKTPVAVIEGKELRRIY